MIVAGRDIRETEASVLVGDGRMLVEPEQQIGDTLAPGRFAVDDPAFQPGQAGGPALGLIIREGCQSPPFT